MARPTAYLFCRYSILEDESQVTPDEEWEVLEEVKGQLVAHRVREPKEPDFDTFLFRPRKKNIAGYTVHTWEVAQVIKKRRASKYDQRADDWADQMVDTDEIRHTKFIALPRLGVFAVDDSLSERTLGAKTAVARLGTIIETLVDDTELIVSFAGTPDDAQRALETWTLDMFSFTVRPFNPTPKKMGEKMHELLVADHVGSLRAVATPAEGKSMKDSHEGLIAEAKGLTEAGYGQYGASGTTPDGLKASLSKPKFTMDKEKNKQAQAQNRTLKVYIPKGETVDAEESAIVKALIDLYG